MKYIDISWPITNDMTTYKDRNDVVVTGKSISCNFHTGTHVDAPAHFITGGKTIDQIAIEKLCGPCRILDMTHVAEKITAEDFIEYDIVADEIILLKTKNSDLPATGPFDYAFIYLDASGAQFLANKNIKAVGIDCLGIERNQPNHPTHKILFEKEIIVFEGLRLAEVQAPGTYIFLALPLLLPYADGAPARAVLQVL